MKGYEEDKDKDSKAKAVAEKVAEKMPGGKPD